MNGDEVETASCNDRPCTDRAKGAKTYAIDWCASEGRDMIVMPQPSGVLARCRPAYKATQASRPPRLRRRTVHAAWPLRLRRDCGELPGSCGPSRLAQAATVRLLPVTTRNAGSKTVTVVPLPTVLLMLSRPPCTSTNSFDRGSPIPVPEYSRSNPDST